MSILELMGLAIIAICLVAIIMFLVSFSYELSSRLELYKFTDKIIDFFDSLAKKLADKLIPKDK